MNNIDKDIERCKELIKTEHANWIGLTNQDAIAGVLSDRETWKKIAEKLAKYSVNCAYGIQVKFKDTVELMKIVWEEVENETNKARHKNT